MGRVPIIVPNWLANNDVNCMYNFDTSIMLCKHEMMKAKLATRLFFLVHSSSPRRPRIVDVDYLGRCDTLISLPGTFF
jgi:hypothetical protein